MVRRLVVVVVFRPCFVCLCVAVVRLFVVSRSSSDCRLALAPLTAALKLSSEKGSPFGRKAAFPAVTIAQRRDNCVESITLYGNTWTCIFTNSVNMSRYPVNVSTAALIGTALANGDHVIQKDRFRYVVGAHYSSDFDVVVGLLVPSDSLDEIARGESYFVISFYFVGDLRHVDRLFHLWRQKRSAVRPCCVQRDYVSSQVACWMRFRVAVFPQKLYSVQKGKRYIGAVQRVPFLSFSRSVSLVFVMTVQRTKIHIPTVVGLVSQRHHVLPHVKVVFVAVAMEEVHEPEIGSYRLFYLLSGDVLLLVPLRYEDVIAPVAQVLTRFSVEVRPPIV